MPPPPGRHLTWHDGPTAGHSVYLGLDRAHHRAVIVLADTGNPDTTSLGIKLLAKGL